MNKFILVLLLIPILLLTKAVKSQEVKVFFYYAPFYTPGTGVHVETYLSFSGPSMYYKLNSDNVYQAVAEVTMLFKNANEVVEFRNFKVSSLGLPDTSSLLPDFINQNRIVIPEGIYNFEMIVKDINAPDSVKPFVHSELVSVDIASDEIAFSGIKLVEIYEATNKQNIFVKNGFECIPYVSEVFPPQANYLRFYAELYNAAKTLGPLNECSIQFDIENINTGKPIKEFSSSQKQKAQNINVVYKEMNISKLPSGNYYLVIGVRDSQNKTIIEKRKFFQRISNAEAMPLNDYLNTNIQNTFVSAFTNPDSLTYYIKMLQPVCDFAETSFINNQLKSANVKVLQQFFYSFWKARNEYNLEKEWNDYHAKLEIVEKQYRTSLKHGFETDRGRVYLQYGPPSSFIIEKSEADAYPYEIWNYYKIGDQTNKKFIFYNKSLVENDYILLNSTLKGETSNSLWNQELYSKLGTSVNSNHNKARELFEEK